MTRVMQRLAMTKHLNVQPNRLAPGSHCDALRRENMQYILKTGRIQYLGHERRQFLASGGSVWRQSIRAQWQLFIHSFIHFKSDNVPRGPHQEIETKRQSIKKTKNQAQKRTDKNYWDNSNDRASEPGLSKYKLIIVHYSVTTRKPNVK